MNLEQLQSLIERKAQNAKVNTRMVFNRITREPYLEVETNDDLMVISEDTNLSVMMRAVKNFSK